MRKAAMLKIVEGMSEEDSFILMYLIGFKEAGEKVVTGFPGYPDGIPRSTFQDRVRSFKESQREKLQAMKNDF